MYRPVCFSLRSDIRQVSILASRRALSARPQLALWSGTTRPYENQKIPLSPQQQAGIIKSPPSSEIEKVERIHRKFVEDLLNRAAASVSGLDASTDTRLKTAVPKAMYDSSRHSMSEPPLFRTDGSLTPYPIELDSGEVLEPKHATLVRIMDRGGEERNIVVAEVEEDSGRRKRVLLAVNLHEY